MRRLMRPGIIGAGAAVPPYASNPVNFDGTNDYLLHTALTGAADSKLFTGSVWMRVVGPTAVFRSVYQPTTGLIVSLDTSHRLRVNGRNAAGTIILDIRGPINGFNNTAWHHVMWSVDMADTGKRHLYIDGASALNVTAYANDTIDFTQTGHAIGANTSGNVKFSGDLADLMLWFGVYVDLSQAENRTMFLASNQPVDPATSEAVLGEPIIQLYGATSTWHTNQGSGGGFTENGALTDGTGPVVI